jgi:hypothetical protein
VDDHVDMGFERDSRRTPAAPTIKEVFDDPQTIPHEYTVEQKMNSNFPARAATEDDESKQ